MRILLDTHVALWFVLGNERLPVSARPAIVDPRNEVFVSVVSLLEIAIKNNVRPTGPDAIGISMADAHSLFRDDGFTLLDLTPEQITLIERLPRHHKDPFDRLLIAQAIRERVQFLTADPHLSIYGDFITCV